MQDSDWPEVQRIYGEGIATGQATFEAGVPDWRHFDHSRLASHRLVAQAPTGGILGWAAVSAVSFLRTSRACSFTSLTDSGLWAIREKIARMAHGPAAGQWRDTVLIERRTQVL
ncbi:hypothetical protein FCN77_11700 [Arthrobacter sp. 24S4-2]|uniref:GNAT family N-acetyltransferase n=1 Tax=Arthrobacter sp. 24S4-2 TaxID=2575374 RepID=UPI0010C7A9F4|nr:hypothetical protein [Arthrobacter sp. 24S4-2]QCO98237.1 hypothetical protein FCN77_11700 [Arthrobacter sp. 24S4-2]